MDVMEAIRNRRTIYEFTSEPVTQEQIRQLLEAATWAPNHKLTNPWEFYVFSDETKENLARLRGELKRSKHPEPESQQAQKVYDRAYGKLAQIPYAILVCQRVEGDSVQQEEDLLAVGAAVQNMMLAAHSMGLGTFWGSSPLINHPRTFEILGVPEGRKGVGLIFVGHPARADEAPEREPLSDKTRWLT